MEFVSKRKKLKVTIDDKSIEIDSPSIGQIEDLKEKMRSESPETVHRMYIDFFKSSVMPEEISLQLDVDGFEEFVTFLLSPKKKI